MHAGRIDPTDLKQQRLIGDISLGTLKLNVRVAEGQYRAKRDGALAQLLADLAREHKKEEE
jgi:hypothetical protein